MVSVSHSNFELNFLSFFSANFLLGSQSCSLRVNRNELKKKNLFEKSKSFLTFYIFELKNFGHLLKLFRGCCQNCSLGVHGTIFNFLENMCFSYRLRTFHEKKVRLYVGNFSSDWQNCFPFFTETFGRKVLSRRKLWVFLTVSENQQILWLFAKKNLIELWKLLTACP